jgi:hypothetical protein
MAKGHGQRLSRKQEQAVAALFDHATIAQAAATVGVSERTLRRWMQEPDFEAEHRAVRRRIVEDAITRLQQLSTAAVLALNRNLTCGNPSVEVRAAQVICDQSYKALEIWDVIPRLAALEARLAEAEEKHP